MNGGAVPRKTSGHHFSSLLTCPQRVWCDYWSNMKYRAPDPPYLVALQNEGFAHEREVSKRLFSHATRIPSRGPGEERSRLTLDAIKAGAPAILQAYFEDESAIAVCDVLERSSPAVTKSGDISYRVGEFKRAQSLQTAHVLQAGWYSNVIRCSIGISVGDPFFILGNGSRQEVPFQDSQSLLADVLPELLALRDTTTPPGPHLSRDCPSCPWRLLCMPQLVSSEHISLLPRIGRRKAQNLAENGLNSWRQFQGFSDADWQRFSFTDYDRQIIQAGLLRLQSTGAVLSTLLKTDNLLSAAAIALDIPSISQQRAIGHQLLPRTVAYEVDGEVEILQLPSKTEALIIGRLMSSRTLMFFGDTDVKAFNALLRRNGLSLTNRSIDLFSVIQSYLHAPVPGLELSQLSGFASHHFQPSSETNIEDRVKNMVVVRDWLIGEGMQVA